MIYRKIEVEQETNYGKVTGKWRASTFVREENTWWIGSTELFDTYEQALQFCDMFMRERQK